MSRPPRRSFNRIIAATEGAAPLNNLIEDTQTPETTPRPRPKRQRRALDILVVEDESVIAKDIELIVCDLGHRVVGSARTHDEALSLALKARPSVIVADVKLADGSSGIVAVDEMLKSVDASVVFVTAAPQWLQTGELEPVLVIPKPYSAGDVKAAIARATTRRAQSMETILATKSAVSRLTRRQ
jgi:DNA-binding LytR/AlgR family response regulator